MSTQENKAIVHRYLEDALAQIRDGKLDATDEFLTGDAAFHDPGQPASVGREAQRQRSAMLLGAFPDVRFAIEDLVAEADKVAVRWVMRATHQGVFAGIPATGRPVAMSGITIYRLAEGRIAEAWSNLDQLGLLQQLGTIPAPAQPPGG
jgi:steroid delta-isomerase-like uncharacterized protein